VKKNLLKDFILKKWHGKEEKEKFMEGCAEMEKW
jgi:hypothetical protein